jgi:cytidylate kinase
MPFLIDEIKDQLEDKIFKIFLFCDEDVRIKRISERNNVSLEESKKIVKSRDYSDIKRYLELYGKDFTNPKYYDLILNNTKMTPEEQNKILEKIIKLFN